MRDSGAAARVTSTGNRLIAALVDPERTRLFRHLRTVAFKRTTLISRGEPVTDVIFPGTGCVVAFTQTLRNGETLEIGMVGWEGVIGALSLCGSERSAWDVVVTVPGPATTLPLATLVDHAPVFASLLRALIVDAMQQAAVLAACNFHHSIQQRCLRWLLMAADRTGSSLLPVTHDVLAIALGVRRPSISLALENMDVAGLIEHRRGSVRLLDMAAARAHACECYSLLSLPDGRLRF